MKPNHRWVSAIVLTACVMVLVMLFSGQVVKPEIVLAQDALVTLQAAGTKSPGEKTEGKSGAGSYTFTLNGEKAYYRIYSLDNNQKLPQSGDVIYVQGFCLVLDEPGDYKFTCSEKEPGILRLNNRIIALFADEVIDEKMKEKKINPLETLSSEEIRQVRGIRLNMWSKGIAEKLKSIDPERTILIIEQDTCQGKKHSLPPLPPSLRYLYIDNGSSEGIKDYSLLSQQDSLRFFIIEGCGPDLDIGYLEKNKDLRFLEAGGCISNFEALKSFRELRFLDLRYCSDLTKIDFVTAMPHLEYLFIQRTGVADLSPLNNHPALRALNADKTKVTALEGIVIPTLKTLRVMMTPLDGDQTVSFTKNNPGCTVYHRWNDSLAMALKKANRVQLVIEERGEKPGKEVIYTENDPAKVTEIVRNINIDEETSGEHCLCVSPFIFRFYEGETLLEEFSLHHGHSIRNDSLWPGDAALTFESGKYLSTLMADHGFDAPLKELLKQKKAEESAQRKRDKFTGIIPPDIIEKLRDARSEKDVQEIFATAPGTPEEKGLMYIRLLGVEEFSWNHIGGFDAFIVYDLLPAIDKTNLAQAAVKAVDDPEGLKGITRLVFWYDIWKPREINEDMKRLGEKIKDPLLDKETLQVILPAIARQGLSSPRPVNRTVVINSLEEIKGTAAVEALRKFISGEITVRPLAEEEVEEPGGMVMFSAKTAGEGSESGIAHAALVLARLKDRGSISVIEKLAKTTTGEDKKVLEQALELLKK